MVILVSGNYRGGEPMEDEIRIVTVKEDIKTSSNSWIKQNRLSKFKFEWQKGYGAFSHSRSQIDTVVKYILNQETHHKKKSFKEEYLEILRKNDHQKVRAVRRYYLLRNILWVKDKGTWKKYAGISVMRIKENLNTPGKVILPWAISSIK